MFKHKHPPTHINLTFLYLQNTPSYTLSHYIPTYTHNIITYIHVFYVNDVMYGNVRKVKKNQFTRSRGKIKTKIFPTFTL